MQRWRPARLSEQSTAGHRGLSTGGALRMKATRRGTCAIFARSRGGRYEFMVLLDADSLMTGETILRLVRTMHTNPRIGVLQTIMVGVLMPSFFAQVFEFGHRLGMLCSAVGAVWWQGDRCQFWGHNAIIRLAPFIEFCFLQPLPGRGPFSGHIICHDQIEASLMQRAGYEIRVLPEESGSYEGMPPTLIEFMDRHYRCFTQPEKSQVIEAIEITGDKLLPFAGKRRTYISAEWRR